MVGDYQAAMSKHVRIIGRYGAESNIIVPVEELDGLLDIGVRKELQLVVSLLQLTDQTRVIDQIVIEYEVFRFLETGARCPYVRFIQNLE